MRWPQSEQDLGPPVVAWLQERGFEVYQEVEMHQGGPRADLVGLAGARLFVVELKKTLGLDVIAQASHWRQYAHQVAVAVPARSEKMFGRRIVVTNDPSRLLAADVLAWKGVGLLEVQPPEHETVNGPREAMPAPLHRRIAEGLREALRPEQRHFARAGNADGRRWTKFQATADLLRRHVEAHPRCTLKQAIAEITHHYASNASARGALVGLLRKGVVEGVALNPHTMTLHVPGDAVGLSMRPIHRDDLKLFQASRGGEVRRG